MKKFKIFKRFPTSFLQSECLRCYHWATTERVQIDDITALLIKIHITVLLARPAFINSWAAIFPQKATTTVCLGFCFHPSSMTRTVYITTVCTCTQCTVSWVRRRGENNYIDLSLFVLLYNTSFMNKLKFIDFKKN